MKKSICKTVSLVLLVVMCVSVASLPASAKGMSQSLISSDITPKYTGLANIVSLLTISPSGVADCRGEVSIRPNYTGDLTMVLERSTNGSSWSRVKTWNTSGSGKVSLSETYQVTSGYQYRISLTVDVYDKNGVFIEDCEKLSVIACY